MTSFTKKRWAGPGPWTFLVRAWSRKQTSALCFPGVSIGELGLPFGNYPCSTFKWMEYVGLTIRCPFSLIITFCLSSYPSPGSRMDT